ncbi:MAG: hypothetical protein ACK2U9_21260, partial [Anaerolineae bacterium]
MLSYRTAARSDARPGRLTNTALNGGLPPASTSLFVSDPRETRCCLAVEKEMVAHDRPPDAYRVEPDLYFQTDMAMYASAEFHRLFHDLMPWLERERLDHDPAELVTGLYRRMLRQADWYAHFNLGNVTMGSGLGLPMSLSPDVAAEARERGVDPAELTAWRLQAWAAEAGVETETWLSPLLIEFAASAPFYSGAADRGERAWDTHDRDTGIVPSAWGLTLLRQSQALAGRLSDDPLLRRITAWQMAQKVKWAHRHLVHTTGTGAAVPYLPHRWELRADRRDSGDSEASNVSDRLVVADADSYLLDQAAALWGMSAMRSVFTARGLQLPQELDALMAIVWHSIEALHLDDSGTVFIDRRSMPSASPEKDGGDRHARSKPIRVEPMSLMFAALAMEDLARNNPDAPMAIDAAKRLRKLRAFAIEKMVSAEGGARAYDLAAGAPVSEATTLNGQFALMRIWLAVPPTSWLDRLTGRILDPEAAMALFRFAEQRLWDDTYGIYRDST